MFFATDAGECCAATAWAFTGLVGLLMLACVSFAAANAERVAPLWLRYPVRSFVKPYLFPWPNAGIDRSPLHLLNAAVAIVALRLLAALENTLLSEGYAGPIGATVRSVAAQTSPVAGWAVVIGSVYIALTLALSPVSAWLITRMRSSANNLAASDKIQVSVFSGSSSRRNTAQVRSAVDRRIRCHDCHSAKLSGPRGRSRQPGDGGGSLIPTKLPAITDFRPIGATKRLFLDDLMGCVPAASFCSFVLIGAANT